MDETRCPECGALYVLVGYRHLCRPRPVTPPASTAVNTANTAANIANAAANSNGSANKQDRKSYQRELMRKRRAAQRALSSRKSP